MKMEEETWEIGGIGESFKRFLKFLEIYLKIRGSRSSGALSRIFQKPFKNSPFKII